MTWIGLNDKLGAEVVKSHGLERELSEVKDSLLKESDEHDTLRVAVQLVCGDLELAPEQEMSSHRLSYGSSMRDCEAHASLRRSSVVCDFSFSL